MGEVLQNGLSGKGCSGRVLKHAAISPQTSIEQFETLPAAMAALLRLASGHAV